jgi:hypothetical protein
MRAGPLAGSGEKILSMIWGNDEDYLVIRV